MSAGTNDSGNIKTSGSIGHDAQSADEAIGQINRELEEKTVYAKSKELKVGYVDISATPINPDLLYLLKPEEAKSGLILPFFRIGKKLRIAVVDPIIPETSAILKQLRDKGYLLNINLASEHGMLEALKIYDRAYKEEKVVENVIEDEKLQAYEKEIKNLSNLKEKFDSITSEEALNYINIGAIKTGASDIHYQPEEQDVLVRFRIDGVLQNIFRISTNIFLNIANQLKYKAKLKLNISNVPQDGRFSFTVNKRKIDVRVSAIPTEYGETFVCRILDSNRSFFDFQKLGFAGRSLLHLEHITHLTNGMVLATGPTGSGKTTTLYSILNRFNNPEKKIITLEDPIEYHLPMISQSQINEKRGYDFANGLRAILRQDPDIIMIGEIRDLETAETAAQAALTGHVVLSTLHTNSAIETIPRLINMGLPPFVIAPALSYVIAQRLVRRVCPDCSTDRALLQSEVREIFETFDIIQKMDSQMTLSVPSTIKDISGCEKCSHTGYLGQIAIIEIIPVDDAMKNLILNEVGTEELFAEARRKKMITIKEDGIMKVALGLTTLEEVHRVTNIDAYMEV